MEEKKFGRRQFLKQVGTAASLCLVGKGLIQPIKAIAETNPKKRFSNSSTKIKT
ncbi:MAG: twin-arginine translocation signal domain-containing protein [Proteobacteria bacterium]|nr:twin-arginine translocation signal domain-containing protein [Pseudomonadota bacterium]